MLESLKNKRILIVAAHPDDEILGVGALTHKLTNDYKCKIHAVILGEGITSRSEKRDLKKWKQELEAHRSNIDSAAKIVGFNSVKPFDFPDNRFDAVNLLDIIKVIEKEKTEIQPQIIFTHHGGDLNIDHRIAFQAVMTACRPTQKEPVKSIFTFEIPSSTEWQASNWPYNFRPNVYFGMDKKNLNAKVKAMECYEFEKRPFPHPRSPKAIEIAAQKRGVEIGANYAEAFMLVRTIS